MAELQDEILDDEDEDEVYPDVVDVDDEDDIEEEVIPELPKIELPYKSYNVYLDNVLIDTVIYPSNLNSKQVRCRLIVQDGYDIDITVEEA